MPGEAGEAAQVPCRHLRLERQGSGAAAVITHIMVYAVIGTMADTVGFADVMVGPVIGAVANTVSFADVMVGAIIGAVADTVQAAGRVVAAIVGAMAARRAAMA